MTYRKKTKDALWFDETYGLMPESLVLRDDCGEKHTVNINGSPTGNNLSAFVSLLLV